jgi:hypothetical protein
MQYKRLAILPAAIAVCGIVSGCFSYHKTVEPTTAPAVVETVPAPAASAVSTTTTTTSDNGIVQKQRTTTYTNPGY